MRFLHTSIRNVIILLFVVTFPVCSLAQNLVSNPSFEDTITHYNPYNCHFLSLHNCQSWKQLNTANYYWFGNLDGIRGGKFEEYNPHSGQCFAGIYTARAIPLNNRECVVGTLKNTLNKDCLYKVKLYISFSNQYPLITKNIDVLFSEKPVFYNDRNTKTITLRKFLTNHKTIDKENNWILYEGEYKANGTENFISIGYFHKSIPVQKNKYRKKRIRKRKKHEIGVFIDDVTLFPLDSCHIKKSIILGEKSFSASNPSIQKTEIIQPKILSKNIYFPYDTYELNASNLNDLKSVVDILNENKYLKAEIIGYSDKKGTENYNLTLSEKRAASVSSYLLEHGIEKKRISYQGKGIDIYSSDENWKLRKVVIHFIMDK